MTTRSRRVRKEVFTLAEANAMLPLVRAIASDLSLLARDVMERRHRLSQIRSQHDRNDADFYQQELVQVHEDLKHDAKRVREYVEELRALGVEPVDGPEGIVSFPGELEGRRVCLCWKLGEAEIQYWHETSGGYRHRRPLMADGAASKA